MRTNLFFLADCKLLEDRFSGLQSFIDSLSKYVFSSQYRQHRGLGDRMQTLMAWIVSQGSLLWETHSGHVGFVVISEENVFTEYLSKTLSLTLHQWMPGTSD